LIYRVGSLQSPMKKKIKIYRFLYIKSNCYNKRDPENQLERLRKYCKSKNGKLLSDNYIGSLNKYKCECKLKHVFETTFNHLLDSKSWCPICAQDNNLVGEELTRTIFESIFNKEFVKIFHEKLINPETNRKLQLDGFNKELNLAFEYQGYQHFIFPNHFHKTKDRFLNRIKVDKIKRKLCQDNNIVLIEVIGYQGERVEESKLKEQIFNKLKERGLI